MTNKKVNHLLTIKSLTPTILETLFQKANAFLSHEIKEHSIVNRLKGKIVANLFFEPSTRTRNSFEIAAKRLDAIVISPDLDTSALRKGESLLDTIHTLEAMGVSLFVIRHPENGTPEWIAQNLHSSASLINAGDGTNQHPTQCLIDLLTISQHKKSWESLNIALVGDILHSRVAGSLIDALIMMNSKQIRLIGPSHLLPSNCQPNNIFTFDNVKDGLHNADVIVSLRLQQERLKKDKIVDTKSACNTFCLTAEALSYAKPDAIVMHPGPMNREEEISSEVADGQQSVILQQVKNGVAIRMAVMDWLLSDQKHSI